MSLAVIPARGGSKRIPRKNIRDFAGRPMIAWSIAAARKSGCFDRIVVSTDDEEIAVVARNEGAEAPFVRPLELADDHTPTIPVIAHAIGALGITDETPVCCIYATAPFLRHEDLKRGRDRLAEGECSYVFAVTPYGFPIQRAVRRDAMGRIAMFDPSAFGKRSQDLEVAWHDAGQFYWARAETWKAGDAVFGSGAVGIDLPRHRVQDIDTEDDWLRAELMLSSLRAVSED